MANKGSSRGLPAQLPRGAGAERASKEMCEDVLRRPLAVVVVSITVAPSPLAAAAAAAAGACAFSTSIGRHMLNKLILIMPKV
jgi:hypothetical protein